MDEDERGWSDLNRGSSTQSRLRSESHGLPELSRNRGGSVFGVVVFCLLMSAYFLVLVGAVVSVSFFAFEQNEISSKVAQIDSNSNGSCILFAGHDSTHVLFPDSPTCLAVIWGLACVAVLAFLMGLGSCLRCVINLLRRISPASPFVVVDMVVLVLTFIGALTISSTITSGRAISCEAMRLTYSAPSSVSNCSSVNNTFSFDHHVYIAEMSSWAVTVLLVLLVIIHLVFCMCCVVVTCSKRSTVRFNVEMDTAVQSPFRRPQLSLRNEQIEDDDEKPIVDPAEPPPSSQYESWQQTT